MCLAREGGRDLREALGSRRPAWLCARYTWAVLSCLDCCPSKTKDWTARDKKKTNQLYCDLQHVSNLTLPLLKFSSPLENRGRQSIPKDGYFTDPCQSTLPSPDNLPICTVHTHTHPVPLARRPPGFSLQAGMSLPTCGWLRILGGARCWILSPNSLCSKSPSIYPDRKRPGKWLRRR